MDVATAQRLLDILARVLVLVIALPMHEFAHAFAAYRCGDPTAKNMGRMSLNPMRHLDPVGFLMLIFVGVGYAKPVPVNPNNYRHYKRGMVWVGIAGVLANLILAFLFAAPYAGMYVFSYDFWFQSLTGANLYGYFFLSFIQNMMWVNIALLVFNLLPIYPLDGFRLVEAATKPYNKFRAFMYRKGQMILFGLLIESILMGILYDRTGISLFYYLDFLGLIINKVSHWIMNPIVDLWELIWRLFV